MKLTIKNFQSHADSTLEFISPGINAIVGKNGHGKSSIFRALKTVPLGARLYPRKQSKGTEVTIDNCTKAKGSYTINGIELKALRNLVPNEVFQSLGLKDVNFRDQHQPYFLLQESPGAVARAMNELTDLGIIDYVAKVLREQGSALESQKKGVEYDLASHKAEVKDLEWAVEAASDLEKIQAVEGFAQEENTWIANTQMILDRIESLKIRKGILPKPELVQIFTEALVELRRTEVETLENSIKNVIEYRDWVSKLPESLEPSLSLVSKRISEAPEIASFEKSLALVIEYSTDIRLCPDPAPDILALSEIQIADLTEFESRVENVVELRERLGKINLLLGFSPMFETITESLKEDPLKNIFDSVRGLLDRNLINNKAIEETQNEFDSLLKESGTCPLCGGLT